MAGENSCKEFSPRGYLEVPLYSVFVIRSTGRLSIYLLETIHWRSTVFSIENFVRFFNEQCKCGWTWNYYVAFPSSLIWFATYPCIWTRLYDTVRSWTVFTVTKRRLYLLRHIFLEYFFHKYGSWTLLSFANSYFPLQYLTKNYMY